MKKLLLIGCVALFAFLTIRPEWVLVRADEQEGTEEEQSESEKSSELEKEIQELTQKLDATRNKKNSLANQILYMDNQITLTSLQLRETGEKVTSVSRDIGKLSDRIGLLEHSLTNVSELLLGRVKATYKVRHYATPLASIFSSARFTDAITKTKYFQNVQYHDKRLLFEVQATKNDFEEQKSLLEKKKKELAALKDRLNHQSKQLDQQKKDKEYLLEVTKNDEKKYQDLLASAKAELEAIQAIIAGRGAETKARFVKTGDRIASVISGASCNSNGSHLHFMVSEKGVVKNPFNYLKSIDHENCSGSSCGSGDGDAFNPSGNWEWPMDPVITYSQGHGHTWAVDHVAWLPYTFHNGIDFHSSSSSTVKAVQDGELYQGSYTGINGCRLRYVRVDHKDSDIDTLYLHINY